MGLKKSVLLVIVSIFLFTCTSSIANTLYFPQVVFGGGYTTTFVIMNTGTTNVSSRINFYDQTGVNRTAYTAAVNIPVGGSTRFTLPNIGPLTVVWGELSAGLATVQGVATFDGRADNGVLITTAGVLGVEAGNSFLLPVDVTPTGSTGVAIANVKDGSSVNIRLRLIGEDGSLVATANDVRLNPLGSHSQIAKFVTELFPQLTGTTFKGTLVVEVTGAPANSLAATALTVKEGLLSALPVIPAPFPIYQSDVIKATVGQLGVASDNSRVGLSVTIENISLVPLYLALQSDSLGRAKVALSDDRASEWNYYKPLVSGIQILPNGYPTVSLPGGRQEDFTAIAPSERITVVMNFAVGGGGGIPGTTFSFDAQGTLYSSSGLKNVSIGLAGIKATP